MTREAGFLGILAKMGMEDCACERKRANFPKFENEGEALAYAKRIATLKPGEIVMYGNQDEDLTTAVYMHPVDGGQRAFVLKLDGDKEVSGTVCPWAALWFPDMVKAS